MRNANAVTGIIYAAIMGLLTCCWAPAAEPAHTRLFENDAKTFYRTPALVISTRGALIAMANACDGPPTKECTRTGIVVRRSTDGGEKWGPVQTAMDGKDRQIQTGAGIVDPSTGEIMFFCTTWPKQDTAEETDTSEEGMIQSRTPWGTIGTPVGYGVLRSRDDGKTWQYEKVAIGVPSAEEESRPVYRFVITGGSDTGIAITKGPHKGRLLVPACGLVDDRALYHYLHPRNMRVPWLKRSPYYACCATAIYSDDHGKTWRAGGYGSLMAAESCVAELPDGSIYLNAAASGGWRAECRSKDSGQTWGQLSLSHLRDGHSGCAASIVSVPTKAGKRPCLVLTAPAHNESGFDSQRDRRKLTANVSFDGGKTWPVKKLINEGPSGYSASVAGKDGAIFVLYEKGDKVYSDKGISMVRLEQEWLLSGKSSVTSNQLREAIGESQTGLMPDY